MLHHNPMGIMRLLTALLLRTPLSLPVLLLLPVLARAHTGGLAQTVPDHDAVLDLAPARVEFSFLAEVTITNIRLEVASGDRTGERLRMVLPRNSIGQSTAFGEHIALELPDLTPGTYKISWQAMSTGGDIIVDDFSFTVTGK
jgi:methionine-rich copper-binding protein CopC